MKYYILSLKHNGTYYVARDFHDLIRWFAKGNRDLAYCYPQVAFDKINPLIHRYKDYNTLLNDIAMNDNDTKVDGKWDNHYNSFVPTLVPRDIMVVDEYERLIDPRVYWERIALYEYTSYFRRNKAHDYAHRFDPVPKTGKRRGKYYRRPRTQNERKQAADVEIKQYVKAKRNHKRLLSAWDDIPKILNNSWKKKRIRKHWMKYSK